MGDFLKLGGMWKEAKEGKKPNLNGKVPLDVVKQMYETAQKHGAIKIFAFKNEKQNDRSPDWSLTFVGWEERSASLAPHATLAHAEPPVAVPGPAPQARVHNVVDDDVPF